MQSRPCLTGICLCSVVPAGPGFVSVQCGPCLAWFVSVQCGPCLICLSLCSAVPCLTRVCPCSGFSYRGLATDRPTWSDRTGRVPLTKDTVLPPSRHWNWVRQTLQSRLAS